MSAGRRTPGRCTYCAKALSGMYHYPELEVPEPIPGQTIERFPGRHFMAAGDRKRRQYLGEGYRARGYFCTKEHGWLYALEIVRRLAA